MGVTVEGKPYAQVQIADTGKGIAPDDLDHIFQYFYRSEQSRNRKSGGSGIGLAWLSSLSVVTAAISGSTVPLVRGRPLPLFSPFRKTIPGEIFRQKKASSDFSDEAFGVSFILLIHNLRRQ